MTENSLSKGSISASVGFDVCLFVFDWKGRKGKHGDTTKKYQQHGRK
jgi:hypothetical protein